MAVLTVFWRGIHLSSGIGMLEMQAICLFAVACSPEITAFIPLAVEVVLIHPGLDGLNSDPERPHLARSKPLGVKAE